MNSGAQGTLAPARRYELVDSLRGIAASSVVFLHAVLSFAIIDSGIQGRLAGISNIAVPIFFVISGFALWMPFVRQRASGHAQPDAVSFYVRRFARIFPAYLVALAAAVIFLTSKQMDSVGHVIELLTLTHTFNTTTAFAPIGVSWSLAVEIVFYACLPLIALSVRRAFGSGKPDWVRGEIIGLAVMFAVSWIYKVAIPGDVSTFGVNSLRRLWAPAYFDMFALGMGLAVLVTWLGQNPEKARNAVVRVLGIQWLCWGLAAALLLWLSTFTGARDSQTTLGRAVYLERHAIQSVVAVLCVAPLVLMPDPTTPFRKVLALRPVAFVGMLSYGLYLWHIIVMNFAVEHGLRKPHGIPATPFWFAFGMAAALLVAWISWQVIEKPSIAWAARWSRRRAAAAHTPAADIAPEPAASTAP